MRVLTPLLHAASIGAALVGASFAAEPLRGHSRKQEAEPTEPHWNHGNNYKYRDTKPAGPTHDQRIAKRKAQRVARRKNRKA